MASTAIDGERRRTLLRLENVSFAAPGTANRLVGPLTLGVEQSEFLALIGKSGVGKSIVLRLLAGLFAPGEGRRLASDGLRIGIALQTPALLDWLSLLDNVVLPSKLGAAPAGDIGHARELLAMMGLRGKETYLPHQLSGGMKSRASIARALMTKPEVLLLDEPFGDLDEVTAGLMLRDLMTAVRKSATAVVMVSHNLHQAAMLADRIVVLGGKPSSISGELKGASRMARESALEAGTGPEIVQAARAAREMLAETPL